MNVGLIYDPVYLEHDTGNHVEKPQRLTAIMSLLESSGLLQQLVRLSPRAANMSEILTVHAEEHINKLESFCRTGGGWLDGDTIASAGSFKAALYAAGGLLRGVDSIIASEVSSAFAVVRPPGHHAIRERAMGFCLLNNVAIAARYIQQNHGLERIAIIDFDVHHGNGTQEAFYDDPGVMYFSSHQFPFYPGSGDVEETGTGDGKGSTVNIPLPAGCGDTEYERVYQEILAPAVRRFRPQFILVSAGYDAHWSDPIGGMQLSGNGFFKIVSLIKELANELCHGRLLLALEGGYNLDALALGVKATFDGLLGNGNFDDLIGESPHANRAPSIDVVLNRVTKVHQLA